MIQLQTTTHIARTSWMIAMSLCLWSAQAQVEFRAVGGQGEEFGEVVVPHGTGAFLLGSKRPASRGPHGSLRGLTGPQWSCIASSVRLYDGFVIPQGSAHTGTVES